MTSEELLIELPNTPFTAKVHRAGSGQPLVYLHGPAGHSWTPLHDKLAEQFTVYAPLHPGWESLADLDYLDSLWDLILYYIDLFDALGLEAPTIVGHATGAMVAAEIAATRPDRVSRLALIAPWGLWRDEEPVADIWGMSPEHLALRLWADPACEAAEANKPSMDPEAALASYVANSSAAHFVWPIPDRKLKDRLRRIVAPSVLIWGESDGVVPVSYAADFAAKMPDARTVIVPDAAHNVHLEQSGAVYLAIAEHLAPVPATG